MRDFPRGSGSPAAGVGAAFLIALTAGLTGLAAMPQRAASAAGAAQSAQTCATLTRATGLPNPSTVITSAVMNPASAASPGQNPQAQPAPGLPEHCEVVGKLNEAVNAILADSKISARLAELGGAPLALSPAAFGKLIVAETDKWGKVIRTANIKAE